MREIKFRAWTGKYMFMQDDQYLGSFIRRAVSEICSDSAGVMSTGHESHLPNGAAINEYLMQYTGLKDKNGIEIYEGDIIYSHHIEDKKTGPVKWSNIHHAYIIDYPRRKGDTTDQWQDMHGKEHCYEVVGNIYENKDLLK